jgi:hypothetical protein
LGAGSDYKGIIMDMEKLLKVATDYFSDYFFVFFATLRTPTSRFQPINEVNEPSGLIVPKKSSSSFGGPKINPKLFGFMIISIFIGTTLNSVVFGQSSSDILVRDTIIILMVWFLYSIAIFGFCKLLRGKGSFLDTLSVSLQLLAVVYVVSNFILLLWAMILLPLLFPILEGEVFEILIYNPPVVYYVIQFFLMFIYLPIALKGVHNFNKAQLAFIFIVPLIFALSFTSSYIRTLEKTTSMPTLENRPNVSYTRVAPVPSTTATPIP